MTDERTEPFRLDDQIGHLLRHAYQVASAHFVKRLKRHNLKPRQFATLARIFECGPMPQNRLGDAVGMPRANIHKMVERLGARGLVETRADPDDCRLRIVALTDEGRALVEELIPLDIESTEDALEPLNENERKTLYALLRRLCDAGQAA